MIACDTETTLIQPDRVPDGVLAVAWAGEGDVMIVPVERWPEFVEAHLDREWFFHNVAFDYHVLRASLHVPLQKQWDTLVEEGRVGCTMLLDGLVRLAIGEVETADRNLLRNLEVLSEAYQVPCAPPDKSSPYRLRFAELLDEPDWLSPRVDRGFFDYAAADCVATYHLAVALLRMAWREHDKLDAEKLHPNHRKYGPLTLGVQVKGACALEDVSRRGFYIDLDKAWRSESQVRMRYQEGVTWLEEMHPGLLQIAQSERSKKNRKGKRLLTSKAHTVRFSLKTLRRLLQEEAQRLGVKAPISTGKQKWISTKAEDWVHLADKSEVIRHWIDVKEKEKQLSYLAVLHNLDEQTPILRSRYIPLKTTGRTGCRKPNIQQTPRLKWFREIHTARPGQLLYVVDYSYIELRTLAYACEKWLGYSNLGKAIRDGRDPHSHTASLLLGELYDHVKEMIIKEKSKDWQKEEKPYTLARQRSKACNFGIPGGLGATKLVAYARLNYGVDMTLEEATNFRHRLIYDIYPELNDKDGWLSTDLPGIVAGNLGLDYDDVFLKLACVDGNFQRLGICLDRVLRGCAVKKDGTSYNPDYVQKLWALGGYLCSLSEKSSQISYNLNAYDPSDDLADRILSMRALTATGRMRAGIGYTEAKNGPFQGLAADGAKLALWRLWRGGYQVVAFIHDEVVVELEDESQGKEVDKILIESMEEVLEGFPVAVEGHFCDGWSK